MRKQTANKPALVQKKSIVELIRQEKEACANKIKSYADELLTQFQQQIGAANETFESLVQDCSYAREDLLNLAPVREFVAKVGTQRSPAAVRRAAVAKDGRKRVSSTDLEEAILSAIGTRGVAHAEIKKSEPVQALYRDMGKKVPNLFIKLYEMTKNKQLVKSGDGRMATYRAL